MVSIAPYVNIVKSALGKARTAALAKTEEMVVSQVENLCIKSVKRLNDEFSHENMKKKLNAAGLTYLMPHEVWSTKKMFDTLDLFDVKVKNLINSGKMNKETYQQALYEVAPELKGKVLVKDFSDLKADMEADMEAYKFYTAEYIQQTLDSASATNIYNPNLNQTKLYFKFEGLETNNILDKIELEDGFLHEPKHVFENHLTNIMNLDTLNNQSINSGRHSIFNRIFSYFENKYDIYLTGHTELTKNNLLKQYKMNSIKELHTDFDKNLQEIISQETNSETLSQTKRGWKQFFTFMQNMAKYEKEAYRSSIKYRKYYGDLTKPTTIELRQLEYEEMENFFHQKKLDLFDDMHRSRGRK